MLYDLPIHIYVRLCPVGCVLTVRIAADASHDAKVDGQEAQGRLPVSAELERV